ncbi:glycerol dehydrogenase [Labrys miyagiensis]|uniref:Glycerol dehydrogenase n=1 Tax=Labrys miyagiensis TaxID=346912 RepID=A0ABQ6CPR9_9HYPH|nr:glycerol dehydrogenase [Labrys miyagiensis]GLS21788.1 glycerol dehydrogenase [Labrys miyagiensis]
MSASQGWHAASGRAFGGPLKYIQRAGEIDRLADHLKPLGKTAFLLVDGLVLEKLGKAIFASLEGSGLALTIEKFNGECCREEIDRVTDLVTKAKADVVVGIGGGKTADTAKLAAIANQARIAIVPTIASTDAPTSAIAVTYTPQGLFKESFMLPRNPDVVVVDSALITKAPVRFLVAGIGDALSTWFEARSNLESRSNNFIAGGYPAPIAGVAIAKVCHETLMRDALAAKIAVEKGALTPAVENIIEANTLLSGLGFENCAVSAAHGIHDALTVLPETHSFFHGEKVAFGVLCLLMLEGRPLAEIEETARFCKTLGLPCTLADLKLTKVTADDIERVAKAALKEGSITWRVAVPLSVEIVRDAIIALDAFTSALFREAKP